MAINFTNEFNNNAAYELENAMNRVRNELKPVYESSDHDDSELRA